MTMCDLFFFFNDTATTEIYSLSLHDALPISPRRISSPGCCRATRPMTSARCASARSTSSPTLPPARSSCATTPPPTAARSEEHTSELQSPDHLVCRLLLEKKKTNTNIYRLRV